MIHHARKIELLSDKTQSMHIDSPTLAITKILSIVIIVLGMIVIGGWIFGVDAIKSPLNRIPMPFIAAISFVLTGTSLYLLSQFYEGKQSLGIVVIPICLLVVFLFMATTLVSVFFNVHTGIETAIENIIIKKQDENTTIPSARPPVPASLVFILVASAQTSVIAGYSRSNKLLQICGTIIVAIASFATIGQILDRPVLFYHVSWSNGVPIHGAMGLAIMGISLILLGRLGYKRNIMIETATIKTRLIFLFIGFMVVTISIFSLWSYDIATTQRPLQEVAYTIIIMVSVVLSTVSVYALIIARSISSGITKLRNVSEDIRKGSRDAKADVNSNDEIGYLGKSLNDMVEDIKKKEEELRTTAKTLEEATQVKDQFSAMVTHELKTPLFPIIGYCKMLMNNMFGNLNKEQFEAVDSIQKNILRLESLINDIMDARKLDLDKMRFHIEDVNVDELFDNLNASYNLILSNQGKKFVTNLQANGLTIKTDKKRLLQVIDNLMSNSMKFIPEKNGEIEIGLKKDDNKIIMYVKDNGIGIPLEKQKDLFKKFYQIDTSERRASGGTGLGLAISKGIVEKLGGSISLESDGKTGTIVYLKLPL